MPLTRYEGLFTCIGIALVFLFLKKWKTALAFICASILPLSLYGGIALSRGWYFFPNSVLLKGNLPQFNSNGVSTYLLDILERLFEAPHLFILILAGLLIMIFSLFSQRKQLPSINGLLVWTCTAFLHLALAKTGWFYRYEAYLVFPGLILILEQLAGLVKGFLFGSGRTRQFQLVCLLIFTFLLASMPSILRAGNAFHDYPLAVKNNVDQQYQMARFIQKFFPTGSVAISDIGAISFYTHAKILDLWGLASLEVAHEKLAGTYNQDALTKLTEARQVQLAILYPYLFEGMLPAGWVEVGRWQITQNVVCAFDTVAIYAPNQSAATELISQLREFSSQLPVTINQSGEYTVQ